MTTKKRLGDFLLQAGLIDQEKLEEAIVLQRVSKERLGRVLVKLGYVTEEDIAQTLSQQLRIPYLSFSDHILDKKMILLVPEGVARNYLLVPVSKKDKVLTVAMVDPLNILAIDELSIRTRLTIEPAIAPEEDIKRAIDELYGGSFMAKSETAQDTLGSEDYLDEGLLEVEEEGPISQLVNLILLEAARERASDIHIEPDENLLKIRYRVDGLLPGNHPPSE